MTTLRSSPGELWPEPPASDARASQAAGDARASQPAPAGSAGRPADDAGARPPDFGRGAEGSLRRRLTDAGIVLAAVAAGVAISLALRGSGEPMPAAARSSAASASSVAGGSAPAPDGVAREGIDLGHPATSPRAAVEALLDAEARRDFAASYHFLSAPDRERYRSPAEWVAAHAHLLPVTGFKVEREAPRDDRAEVVTLTDLAAGLDEVVGLVPAQARIRWTAVAEDGGWRVAYAEADVTPLYPDEAGVTAAAREWATARQQCTPGRTHAGGLIGRESLAASLCGASGPVETSSPASLPDDIAVTPFLSAFGPEVGSWARVVRITSPATLDVVLAPLAEEWVVLGVLEPKP